MACKYFTTTIKVAPGGSQVGGPITPQGITVPICRLGRKPDTVGWPSQCDETPTNGPCWYWIEEHGSAPDLKFAKN